MMAIRGDFHRPRGIGPEHWEQEQWRDDCRETFRVDEMATPIQMKAAPNRRPHVS